MSVLVDYASHSKPCHFQTSHIQLSQSSDNGLIKKFNETHKRACTRSLVKSKNEIHYFLGLKVKRLHTGAINTICFRCKNNNICSIIEAMRVFTGERGVSFGFGGPEREELRLGINPNGSARAVGVCAGGSSVFVNKGVKLDFHLYIL